MSIKNTMAKLAAIADLYPDGADGSLKIWRDPERAGQEALSLGDCRAIRDELHPPFDFRRLTTQERRLFEDVRASETGIVLDEARSGQPLAT